MGQHILQTLAESMNVRLWLPESISSVFNDHAGKASQADASHKALRKYR